MSHVQYPHRGDDRKLKILEISILYFQNSGPNPLYQPHTAKTEPTSQHPNLTKPPPLPTCVQTTAAEVTPLRPPPPNPPPSGAEP